MPVIEYSKYIMEQEKDSRINVSVIQKALVDQFKVPATEVEVVDWKTGAGSAAGDGFCCDMVTVKGQAKIRGFFQDFSYMSKVLPKSKNAAILKEVKRNNSY